MAQGVAEFSQNVDEAAEKVNELLKMLDQAYIQMKGVCSELEVETQTFDDSAQSVNTSLGTLTQFLQTTLEEFNISEEKTQMEIDSLLQGMTDIQGKLDQASQSVEEAQSNFESEVNNSKTELDGNLVELKDAFSGLTATISNVEESLGQGKEETQQTFDSFAEAITELQQQVGTFQSEIETDFEKVKNDISETHTSEIETLFSNFSDQLIGQQQEQITSSFDELETSCTNLFSNFGDEVDGLGEDMKERITEIMQNTAQYAEETLTGELRDAFSNAIEDAVEAMISEVGENILMMTAGSSVTGALGPILPGLVAAKVAVEAINAVLDALNPF